MRTCAFSLSFKGSAEGSGRQRGRQRRKRAWGSENAQGSAKRSKESAHGVAKMRKGSENAQRQRKCAVAAAEAAGDSVGQRILRKWQRKCAKIAHFRYPALPFAPLPILSKTSGAWVAKDSGAPAFFPPSCHTWFKWMEEKVIFRTLILLAFIIYFSLVGTRFVTLTTMNYNE